MLTNTSTAAEMANAASSNLEALETDRFLKDVLTVVAEAGGAELSLVSLGLEAVRLQREGDHQCKIVLGRMYHLCTEKKLRNRIGRALHRGKDISKLAAELTELRASHRAGLERLAPRSAVARGFLEDMAREDSDA